ncbi:hypothetical protein IAT38_001655 [Cryptococcus sp. DSM 104549]
MLCDLKRCGWRDTRLSSSQCPYRPPTTHPLFRTLRLSQPPGHPYAPFLQCHHSSCPPRSARVHRRPKANLIAHFTPLALPVPTILLPIFDMLPYTHMYGAILSLLKNLVDTLRQAGLGAEVVTDMLGDDAQDGEALRGIVAGETGVDGVKGRLKMTVQGCPGIAIEASASHLLPSSPTDNSVCGEAFINRQEEIYHNELEESVVIDRLGFMKITIPPPFHSVFGSVDSDRISAFDSRHEDDLSEWFVTDVAAVVGGEETDGVACGKVWGDRSRCRRGATEQRRRRS